MIEYLIEENRVLKEQMQGRGRASMLATAIFWLVVGWRAMRAHEEIAALLRERPPQAS